MLYQLRVIFTGRKHAAYEGEHAKRCERARVVKTLTLLYSTKANANAYATNTPNHPPSREARQKQARKDTNTTVTTGKGVQQGRTKYKKMTNF